MGLGIFSLKNLKQQVRKTGGENQGEEEPTHFCLSGRSFKQIGTIFTRNKVNHFSRACHQLAASGESRIYIYLAF